MQTVGAIDPTGLSESFRAFCAARFGGRVELVEPALAARNVFDNFILFVHLRGERLPAPWQVPLVLRVQPTAERLALAHREAAVQTWCADRGYPAPRVLALLTPGELVALPVQVMERAAGVPMLDAMRSAPWRTRGLLTRLADLHLRLHSLSPAEWPGDVSLADRRLAMPRVVVPRLHDRRLSLALERAEEIAPTLDAESPVVCHGDFHWQNVLVDRGGTSVIDWTDAALGDRHGDVSRTALLFLAAGVAATRRAERVALLALGPLMRRSYLKRYTARYQLDLGRLRRWEALHCVHAWAQIMALHAGLLDDPAKPGASRRRVSPQLAPWLEGRFERAASTPS